LNKKVILSLCIICSIAFLSLTIQNSWGAPTYTVSAAPSTVNLAQNVTITVSWNGGTAGVTYTFKITVNKPGGTGSAWASVSRAANSTGGQSVAVTYPNPASTWTLVSGTVNTDLEGTYGITVDKTAPNPVATGVATTTFIVKHDISVAITSPSPSVSFYRGSTVTITASLTDVNGQRITTGSALASTPRSSLGLTQTSSPGTYSAQYQIQLGDTLGNWNLTVSGTMPGGNYGSSTIYVTILPAQLIVSSLATFNAQGNPTADFSPGDSLYATFRIAYSSSGFLQQGSFDLQVRDPSGTSVANLLAIYDPNRDLFYDPSGFQISSSDPAGAWELIVPTNSLNDSYGNVGPSSSVTYRFQIHQPQSTSSVISPVYFALAALAIGGGLGATVVARQFNKVKSPFDDLFKLTGGAIQAPSAVMISGDSGSGTTTMALQLLHKDLVAGKYCGLLSYDAFPAEIKRRMRDMGWDITPYLENGHLAILDIYSALAGVEGTTIREPTDFTEISIQTTHMIEKAKGPITLLLDSVTPMFNSATTKDCINFLQVIAAKVKNSGGIFIFTATKGSIPEEARLKIESLADGVIELSLVKRAKSLTRFLMVKKISGRQISSVETEFEIVTGKGIVLVKQRLPLGFLAKK
jgi:KaiC/GvpD/RAD55 family RecA-like ATPase